MIFNLKQRTGVVVLLALVFGVLVLPRQLLPKRHGFFLMPVEEGVEEGVEERMVDGRKGMKGMKGMEGEVAVPAGGVPGGQGRRYASAGRPAAGVVPVELNTADSAALVALRGIGPYYAARILRYRERLGGFHSVGQLKELNMQYFHVDSNAHLFTVNPALVRRADLDTMAFKAVLRHPYLEYEDVRLMFDAKRRYGHLSYAVLEEHGVLPAHKLKKIKPYFK